MYQSIALFKYYDNIAITSGSVIVRIYIFYRERVSFIFV